MSTTSYSIKVDGEQVDTRSKKDKAIELADGLRGDNETAEITVENASTNDVVHTVAPAETGRRPWSRVEENTLGLEVPEGYTPSYKRTRVKALVCRADDRSGLIVITPDETFQAKNTKEAREITNKLAADFALKRAEEKAAEAKVKADEKAKKDAEKAAAKAKADAEKAEKAAEKARKAEEAKEAKEAKEAADAAAEAENAEVEAEQDEAETADAAV